jgi:hypothetical protein
MDYSDDRTERALNAFAVVLSVSLFARGFEFHVGFAVFMAVAVPLLLRLTLGLLVYEYRHETWVDGLEGRAEG